MDENDQKALNLILVKYGYSAVLQAIADNADEASVLIAFSNPTLAKNLNSITFEIEQTAREIERIGT